MKAKAGLLEENHGILLLNSVSKLATFIHSFSKRITHVSLIGRYLLQVLAHS